jgi:hypothetical protein
MVKTRRSRSRGQGHDLHSGSRLILIFVVLTLMMASPFIYRAWQIHEIYIYSDVRAHVLDSVFLLREQYGLTIGDLTIKDVVLDGPMIFTTVHEKYHGFVEEDLYDNLEQDYIVRYHYDDDTLEVGDVMSAGR